MNSPEKNEERPRRNPMLIPTVIMGVLALVLLYTGYRRDTALPVQGMRATLDLLVMILPLLLFAFIVASMVQLLLPREQLARWVGAESGMRGILLGTVAGGISPGGPFVSLPIAVALMRAGAGAGTMVAYLTAWSLWGVARLPMEVGILGWRLTAIRLASTFFFPPIAGLIANLFFSRHL
jgi:uncharacterized membrane protein YraQ (UPF0718 family)